MDLDLVWHSSEAWIALVLPVSVKDHPLHWILVKSQTYYPEHILAYRAGRLVALLSWVLALSRLTDWGQGWWRLNTTLSPRLRCGGLESKFGRGSGPLDRRVVGWSYLCLGYKRGVCFGVPSWATLIHESPCNMV